MGQNLAPLTPSTLYLVATPIGNLEDTGRLLQHFDIPKPLLSCFQFNESKRSQEIIERLRLGEKIALVTDAGSPGISDPGERLVKAVWEAGFRVEPVPGACALVAGLTASGLPTGEFHFAGFLPRKSAQRLRKLGQLRAIEATLVLYESLYRVKKCLAELVETMPDREVVVARELTKKFEEFLRGKPAQLIQRIGNRNLKGEFVIMIQGHEEPGRGAEMPQTPRA